MERALSFLVWIRRALLVAVSIGVVIVILHSQKPVVLAANAFVDEGPMPDLDGALGWLNSEPLNRKSLRGKVVLVATSTRPLREEYGELSKLVQT